MRFGYFTLTDNPPAYGSKRRDPNQFFNEVIEEAVEAETVGLNSVWLPEHHFGLFGCLGATSTALAYIAAKTKRVKLAPATVLLPCNHPVRVAEQFCTLDQLSGGRAILSAGRGYDKREYDAFGIPFDGEPRALRRGDAPGPQGDDGGGVHLRGKVPSDP